MTIKKIFVMAAEFLREAAVLIFVFGILDQVIQHQRLALRLTLLVLTAVTCSFALGAWLQIRYGRNDAD